MIPEFPTSPTAHHTDHRRCADPYECLVESLTQSADWAVFERQVIRQQRIEGQEFHVAPISC